ncbi:MAG: hypothetical protein LAO55_03205 [Acidobacteriia bacterium]|nr:hypothetical protein [Terriglobia bacterium]
MDLAANDGNEKVDETDQSCDLQEEKFYGKDRVMNLADGYPSAVACLHEKLRDPGGEDSIVSQRVVEMFFRDILVPVVTPELIAAIQVFGATLSFVSICLGLTKTLVDVGVFKKALPVLKSAHPHSFTLFKKL